MRSFLIRWRGAEQRCRMAFRVTLSMTALVFCMALADGSWLQKVPADYHTRVNPQAGQTAAIKLAGQNFSEITARSAMRRVLGRGTKPICAANVMQQQATAGDIFWLLYNGNLRRGMPTWSAMPEPSRWQIIAYVKSLGPAAGAATAVNYSEEKSQ